MPARSAVMSSGVKRSAGSWGPPNPTLEVTPVVADHKECAARRDRLRGVTNHVAPNRRREMDVDDHNQIEGALRRCVGAQIRLYPFDIEPHGARHASRLLQGDVGEIDGGHVPAALGQPDGVAPLATAKVEGPTSPEI